MDISDDIDNSPKIWLHICFCHCLTVYEINDEEIIFEIRNLGRNLRLSRCIGYSTFLFTADMVHRNIGSNADDMIAPKITDFE